MNSGEPFAYTGTALLEANEAALPRYNRWIVEQFVSCLPKPGSRIEPPRVADFGAGVGTLTGIFREVSGIAPWAIEPDPAQRDVLVTRGFQAFASAAELPAPADLIYSSNVLEHIPDDVGALRSLRDCLREDGTVALFVPAFEAIWTAMDDKIGHCRRYTVASLGQALAAAGYEVRAIGYCDPLGFLMAFAFKFIGSSSGEPGALSLKLFDRAIFPISRMLQPLTRPLFGKNILAVAQLRR